MSSLVAYGASDDSESEASDVEESVDNGKQETETNVNVPNNNTNIKAKTVKSNDASVTNNFDDEISDEEEYQQTGPSTSLGLTTGGSFDLGSDSSGQSRWGLPSVSHHSQSQGLPAPKKREEIEIEESELEEEVKQKPTELAEAPKPPPKRTKQPVKIMIPSLNDIPDEDEANPGQKLAASKVRSGLFSLLPPPVHSSRKEINRPLIPHSLSKKTPTQKPPTTKHVQPSQSSIEISPVKSAANSITKTTVLNNLSGYDDSDDENDDESNASHNFFSLGQGSKKSLSNKSLKDFSVADSGDTISSSSSKVHTDIVMKDTTLQDSETSSSKKEEERKEIKTKPEPGFFNDTPLDFGHASRFTSWSSASSSYIGGVHSNHSHYPAITSSVQYNMVDPDGVDRSNTYMTQDTNEFQHMVNDKEFQKIQGKRKRGMEEINFVDANVDDYVDPSELSKHISEETEYTSAKNKEDMPTSQQRRKKQITYLAFQAKEKELELKNTWSQNKLTRRQTQAKYGF